MMTLPKNWKPDEYTDWYHISRYEKLSEEFIREFKDYVHWYSISRDQELSESFILEFKDKVNWYCISCYQKLSESFIREFKDKVDWDCIFVYQKHLSIKFLNKYQYLMDFSWIDARDYF